MTEGIIQKWWNNKTMRERNKLVCSIYESDIKELIEKIKQVALPFSEQDNTTCITVKDLIGDNE